MATQTRLRLERTLVWCLRSWSQPGSTFAVDLADAWRRRHPTHLDVFITDDDGNVIEVTDDEVQERALKRMRVEKESVDALYTELFPGQLAQPQAPYSMIPTLDDKERILKLVMDVADEVQPMTRLFSMLAMQFTSKDTGGLPRHLLQKTHRPPAARPSFSFITRLMDEGATPQLFAWALWLYTGNTTNAAAFLSVDELTDVAFHVVKVDEPEYLHALLLGVPQRTASLGGRPIYRHLLDVIIPLALIKARFVGWDRCRVLQNWILDRSALLREVGVTGPGTEFVYRLPNGASLLSAQWVITHIGGAVATWYEYEEDVLGLLLPNEDVEHDIPLQGLQWLQTSGVLAKTGIMDSRNRFGQFLHIAYIDSVAKAEFVQGLLAGERTGRLITAYLRLNFQYVLDIDAATRVRILVILISNQSDRFVLAFDDYVHFAIADGVLDYETARVMRSILRMPSRPFGDIDAAHVKFTCAKWFEGLLAMLPPAVVRAACEIVLGFVSIHGADVAIAPLFARNPGRAVPAETDAVIADFIHEAEELELGLHWERTLAALQRATYLDANNTSQPCLPLTTAAVASLVT